MAQAISFITLDNAGDAGNEVVTSSRGRVHKLFVHNDHTSVQFIHLYDAADSTSVTPASAAGDLVIPVRSDWSGEIDLCGWGFNDGLTVTGSTTAAAGGSNATTLDVLVVYN